MNLDPIWELRECKDYPGRVYYYNKQTHESTWIRPKPYPGTHSTNWPPYVYLSQIVIKFDECEENSSYKGPATRTKEEAFNIISQLKKEIESGSRTFEDIASSESEVSEKPQQKQDKKAGDIGWISRGDLSPELEREAWSLKSGVMSSPILTSKGYVLLLRRG